MRRRVFLGAVCTTAVLAYAGLFYSVISAQAEDDVKNRRVKAVLDSPVSMEFQDNTLKEVMSFISSLLSVDVSIDTDALKTIDISEKTKLTYKSESVPANKAISHMLATVHKDLIYEIKNGELLVTVKKKDPTDK